MASVFVILFLLFITGRMFFFDFFNVSSLSMVPNLYPGDVVVISKQRKPVKSGDIIAFYGTPIILKNKGEYKPINIKRVVAMAGDTIAMDKGNLMINGKTANSLPYDINYEIDGSGVMKSVVVMKSQGYIEALPTGKNYYILKNSSGFFYNPSYVRLDTVGEMTVPLNHYFVLGDLRDGSLDSRHFGFVAGENIIGKVGDRIIYSLRSDFWKKPKLYKIKWHRFGKTID